MKNIVIAGKNIFWLYKPYWKYGKHFVCLSLVFWLLIIPAAQLVGVYLPSTIVNMLESGRAFSDIVLFVVAMQLLLMFQPVYEDIFNLFCKNRLLAHIHARLRRDVYEKAIQTDYAYIDDPHYYDRYTWAVSQYADKAAEAQNLVNRMSSSIITVLSMLAIIATLSPLAVLVTILGTTLENIMYIVSNRYDVKKDEEILPHDRRLGYHHRIFYTKQYAADLKCTNAKESLFRDFEKTQRSKLQIIKGYAYKLAPWSLAGTLTFYITRTFVILHIAYGIYTADVRMVGTYIAMMTAVGILKDALNELFYYVKDANRLGLYAKRIRAFFEVESHIETDTQQKERAPVAPYNIEFDNVSFQYTNSDFQISHLNLQIKAGEKIAIVGENGVGKTTLVKLLTRLYDVQSGSIRINGKDLRIYDIHELRKKIGVAFQNANLYAMSFAENIGLYKMADSEQLARILEQTGLQKVLAKSNATPETELTREFDERGLLLSGGEAQMVGIARLLTDNFGLLLFDEPSSALDPLAEYEMTKMILDGSNRSTTIIIAHRLSTIRNADRIVLIDGGTVKEMGTHEELMSIHGKYYEMFTKQAENYIG